MEDNWNILRIVLQTFIGIFLVASGSCLRVGLGTVAGTAGSVVPAF